MKALEGSALLICDMWDRHWCASATARGAALAAQIDELLERARPLGAFVIHSPSETMQFYEGSGQRARMTGAATVHAVTRDVEEPQAAIKTRTGCPDHPPCPPGRPPWPWTRQHEAIRIHDEDGITDVGAEVYSTLRGRGIDRLLYAGVHTDQCVLDRSFGIRQMRRWGVQCALIGDLTEAFWPDETAVILAHIDRYLCPVISSSDLF